MFQDDTLTPIFMQVAHWIKDEIVAGNFREEEPVLSTNQLSSLYSINPATANKGLNLLVEEGILYKKRGIGMFVASGAVRQLEDEARQRFREETIVHLLREAEKLGISKQQLLEMIEEAKG